VALYSIALDERIAAAAVTMDSLSYRQEVKSGLENIYADVPRILTWGDTPQVAALAAPRPLAIFNAGVPSSRKEKSVSYFSPLPGFTAPTARVSEHELRDGYDWTKRFYGVMGAEANFETGLGDMPLNEGIVRWFTANF